jgi:hypothetical protein
MSKKFFSLNCIHETSHMHLISAEDLRTLCAELNAFGGYQIQACSRASENEKTGRIDIIITYVKA